MGLTTFEIMFGSSIPNIPNLQAEVTGEGDNHQLLDNIKSVPWVHKYIWPKLYDLYKTAPPLEPHPFQPRVWVLVKRQHPASLNTNWKDPFIILLFMPTAPKVDELKHGFTILMFELQTKLHLRTIQTQKKWRAIKHPSNPLKLKLQWSWWPSLLHALKNPNPSSPLMIPGPSLIRPQGRLSTPLNS